jgi:hypothetical protein
MGKGSMQAISLRLAGSGEWTGNALEEGQLRMARVGIPCSTGFSDVKSSSRVGRGRYRPT